MNFITEVEETDASTDIAPRFGSAPYNALNGEQPRDE
jgi:hypothetical protein